MINKLLILSTLILGIMSCSERNPNSPYDDDTNIYQNNSKNTVRYFPKEIGSYWIYETYDLDTVNRPVMTSLTLDSIIAENELTKAGKKATQFVKYSKPGEVYQKAGEFYYAIEKGKLYSLQTYLSKFFQGVPFELANFSENEWIEIIDPDDDLWRIYRMKLENVSIPNMPLVKMNGKIDVLASWEGKKSLNVNGKSVDTDEYLITFEFDAVLAIPLFGNINISIERELYQYYANDIGLVYENLTSSALSFPIFGNINLTGYQSKLIKYNIK